MNLITLSGHIYYNKKVILKITVVLRVRNVSHDFLYFQTELNQLMLKLETML